MSTLDTPLQDARHSARLNTHPAGSWRFDLTFSLLNLWFLIGLFVDGWAHNSGKVDSTFFTPWHFLLYSGILASGAFLALNQFLNVGRGYRWVKALPKGYLLSLFGVVGFFVGGGLDFGWHEMFGFEADLEALLSPSHLLLALSGLLIITGPLRANAARAAQMRGWAALLPQFIALLVLMSLVTFFAQYASLWSHYRMFDVVMSSQRYFYDVTVISYILVTVVITMGFALFALRVWHVPFGWFTGLFALNAALNFALSFERQSDYPLPLLAAPLAGLVADVLVWKFRPSARSPVALRIFMGVVPFVMTGACLGLMIVTSGIAWKIHMWLGAVISGVIASVALSYVAVPPRMFTDVDAPE